MKSENEKLIKAHQAILAACKEYKFDPEKLPHTEPQDEDELSDNAYKILKHIVKSVNKGHVCDYKNANEYKWWPWFDMNPNDGSGFAFSDADALYAYTDTSVGPRLSYVSEKLCVNTVKKNLEIYKAYQG